MKLNASKGLAMSIIFRILILLLRLSGNPYRQRVSLRSWMFPFTLLTELFFIRVLHVGEIARKKLFQCERGWDLIDFPDILL